MARGDEAAMKKELQILRQYARKEIRETISCHIADSEVSEAAKLLVDMAPDSRLFEVVEILRRDCR